MKLTFGEVVEDETTYVYGPAGDLVATLPPTVPPGVRQTLVWAMVEAAEFCCNRCGEPFTQESLDGGRCLGVNQQDRPCLSMITGE